MGLDLDHEGVTLGEVHRTVKRLETAIVNLSTQMTVALGPIGELRVHVENAQKDIDKLGNAVRMVDERTDKIELRAAGVAGGVTAIALLLKFLLGK